MWSSVPRMYVDQKVIGWRTECLVRAGWSELVAAMIAEHADIDIRLAERTINCGDEFLGLYLLGVVDTYSGDEGELVSDPIRLSN